MQSRLLSLTLSSTIVAFAAAPFPAGAQATPQTPAAQAVRSPAPGESVPPQQPPVLPAVPNIAPGYAAPVNTALPGGDLVGVAQQPFVGITLADAVTMALQRNTDLAISSSNQRIANYQVVAAKGGSDVRFALAPSYQHTVSPAQSPFSTGPGGGPITQIASGVQGGFRGQTPYGTQYALTGTAQSIFNNGIYNSYNPFYSTALSLQLTQPLLRGRGENDESHQIQLAAANAQVQNAVLLTQASQTITNVADTYWDLVAAWRAVAIQEEGLREAQAQAESNTRLANQGAVAPVDVVESNTQVDVFQDNVFSALQNVQRLQTQLKALVLANPADPLWTANLVPTSAVIQLPAEPKLEDLIVTALQNRPEVAQLRAARLVAAANLAYAKNQRLPQLDLSLGATNNGFAGVPADLSGTPLFQTLGSEIYALNALIARANLGQPPANQIPQIAANFGSTPAYQDGKLGTSWQNLFQSRFPAYTVGLTLSFPLENRTAKAEYAIAEEQSKQVAVQELALLQRIRADSVIAIQTLRETQYRLVAAGAARTAAERVLVSEQRKFKVGNSTTYLVLQRQLELADDKGRELQAQTDLNKAVVELDRVAGTNFAANKIDVSRLGGQTLDAQTPSGTRLPPK